MCINEKSCHLIGTKPLSKTNDGLLIGHQKQLVKFDDIIIFIEDNVFEMASTQFQPFSNGFMMVTTLKTANTYHWILICRIDGCCRHAAATLFEVMDFQADNNVASVTSGLCVWKQRIINTPSAVLAAELPSALDTREHSRAALQEEGHRATHIEQGHGPPLEIFLNSVKQHTPGACMLDAWEVRHHNNSSHVDLPVLATEAKMSVFLSCHNCSNGTFCDEECWQELESYMVYSELESAQIEEATRGQHQNQNWHNMRKYLLTSSVFKKICHSQNPKKTAFSLLNGPGFSDDNVPQHIQFGYKFENKARTQFMRTHQYHHRECTIQVPGFIVHSAFPFLGTSPDGILSCNKCGGKALVEVKCLSLKRNFQPTTALIMNKVAKKDDDGKVVMNTSHGYYYQIQGQWHTQMSPGGIYTQRNTCYDHQFWSRILAKCSCQIDGILSILIFPSVACTIYNPAAHWVINSLRQSDTHMHHRASPLLI